MTPPYSQSKNIKEEPIDISGLFQRSSVIESMHDPLNTLWNNELTEEQEENKIATELLQLIDFSQMNSLFQNFLEAIGLPVAIIDLKGAVLASSKWQRLCVEFHRVHTETFKRCVESDISIYAQLEAGKNYAVHNCQNGLIDCASPIVIEGHHIANLFIGQFFIKPPDITLFKRYQQQFDFKEEDYFDAISQVPIVNVERLPAIMKLLVGWAQQIATHTLAEKRTRASLSDIEKEVSKRTQEFIKNHALLQTAQKGAKIGHYITDLSTGTWTNDALFDEVFGIDEHFVRNFANWQRILHPQDCQQVMKYYADSLESHELYPTIEYRIVRPNDGQIRWIAAWGYTFYNEEGLPVQQVGLLQDITERKLAEIELTIAATVFESHEGMLITDANKIILKVNSAFTRLTGYTLEEVIGKTPNMLGSARHSKSFYAELWKIVNQTGAWAGEVWNRRKNGEVYPEWLTITAVKGLMGQVTHYVATMSDITERKQAEEHINKLAFYDPLTELGNRRLLHDSLKRGIEFNRQTGRQLAVLMIDLDKFKAVNDNLGHSAGDNLLQQVSKRMKQQLRESDKIARLGGDEFVIILEDLNHSHDAAHIAEALIETLSEPFILNEIHDVYIGASIGIAIHPYHGDTVETLLDNADTALYHAKDNGRGCFAYFSEELTLMAKERIALETRLRYAVQQQELRVYFQPQVDINSGKITGAEALVRWYNPLKGCLMPNNFIRIAEETGFIVTIGEWVLRETCRLGKKWLDEGLPSIILAVNVSPHQFRRCDINQLVANILQETGFPAQYLELEITETGLMNNQEQALTILNQLHEQGISLAIDDFGTGYSSLAYLKYFPVDILKIDKTFIDDIPFLESDMAIASTIISMAHHLGFKVLAEGVENDEQLSFLKDKHCDMYQGYLFSRPLPADNFAYLLANNQKNTVYFS